MKRIIKALVGMNKPDAREIYIRKGIIKVGPGCDISGMNIFIVDPREGVLNIEIGCNTCIRGSLIVYRKESKIKIGNDVYIGPGTKLECVETIEVGNNVLISSECNIIDTNSHSIHSEKRLNDTNDWKMGLASKDWSLIESSKITIHNKCWIGLRSIIMKGVDLGEGTIVAAGGVVTKSSEAFTLIGGNPARFIKAVD